MKQIVAGPMASPSRPSVRLTALADPTITRSRKGCKQAQVGEDGLEKRNGDSGAEIGPDE